MRRSILTVAGLLAAACLCSGCWPMRLTSSPGASGVILNSQTRAPVAGAQVVVSLSKYPPDSVADALEKARAPKVVSDASGLFSVPPERRWGIYILPMDIFPQFGLLVLKHDGYQPGLVPVWSRSTTNLGPVLLVPAAK